MKFVILAPNYTEKSAGTRSLFRLCHWLNVLGHDASVTTPIGNPNWKNPNWNGDLERDSVVIYPEVVSGNPLNAERVARWVLYYPGRLGGDSVYDENEKVFWPLPWFEEAARAATPRPENACGLLYCSTTHPAHFFPGLRERDIDVIFLGKRAGEYHGRAQSMITPSTVLLHGLDLSDRDLGKMLRRARTLYTFDEHTMLMYEAQLCGAPVQVWDDGAWRALDQRDRLFSPLAPHVLSNEATHDWFHPTGIDALIRAFT